MIPEQIDPADLHSREVGPVTILFGYENGKYPHGNSCVVHGTGKSAMVDPCLGVVARRNSLPDVDLVLHSHTHEDHIAYIDLLGGGDSDWSRSSRRCD